MNIVIVTYKFIKGDGQGRVNYEIAMEAIRRGHRVTLLATQIAAELQQSNQVKWIKISVEKWSAALFQNLAFSRQSNNWLQKYCNQFDLVQINGTITSFPADINAVHFIHSSWLNSPYHTSKIRRDLYGFYHWIYSTLNSYWEKRSFNQSKFIVAVSNKVKKDLLELGISPNRIQVILNGVDLEEFCPGNSDRHKFNLPEKVPLALFVGDIKIPRKNLDIVLYALVNVPELHLAVVGSTHRSLYPSLAAKLGLSGRVHFLGYRQDVTDIMKAADLFVLPSHYETYGLVLLEAMASGLPVITAKTVGASEIVTPECGVVLNDSQDMSGLVNELKRLTSSEQLREQMGRAGRNIAERHSWTGMASNYIDMCESLETLKP